MIKKLLIIFVYICFTKILIAQDADVGFRPAKILKKFEAKLPESCKKLENGSVSLKITVLPDSTVGQTEVLFSSKPELEENAIATVKTWKFQPATQDGIPQSTELMVNINFEQPVIMPSIFKDIADSTAFILDSLSYVKRITKYAENTNIQNEKHILPAQFLSENYHLQTNPIQKVHIYNDNHLAIPIFNRDINSLQKYLPFNKFDVSGNVFQSYSNDEFFIPAITYTEMYFGDYDMNYALIDFRKGNLFNQPNLFTEFMFFGSDGYWLGSSEKDSNFKLLAGYDNDKFKFTYQTYFFNSEFDSNKLYQNDSYLIEQTEKIHQLSFYSEIINFSLRNSNIHHSSINEKDKKNYFQVSVNRKFDYKLLNLFSNLEMINNHLIGKFDLSETKWNKSNFSAIYVNKDNFLFQTVTSFPIFNNWSSGFDYVYDNFDENEILEAASIKNTVTKLGIHLDYENDDSKYYILFGSEKNEIKSYSLSSNIPIIESKISYNTNLFDKEILLKNENKLYLNKNDYAKYSEIFDTHYFDNIASISIEQNLKHKNSLGISLEHHFLAMDTIIKDEFLNILNLKIKVKITDYFEINANAMNMLSQERLWGNELNLFHYSAGIKWIFLN